jgi:WD40 repeat protein
LDSKFAIKPKKAHTRIAKACLKYLTGDEMKPPRNSRRGAALDPAANRKDFSQYACTSFSYHLAKADPYDDELLCLLDKFLKSNVLAWIEVIAYKQDLFPLIRVAKNLRTYLNARSTARSPLGPELQLIRGWSTDFIRIAARFADALVLSPSAIYSLIISFCPTTSSAYKTVNNGRRLQIAGLSNLQWEDRLCCIEFQQGQASALCIGDDYMAVGLTNGTIKLYHAASCQEYRILDHGEAVKFLQFKSKSAWMASCGMKYVRVWDVCSGERVYNFQAPQRPISLVFDDTLLITASHKNSLVTWHLEHDGIRMPDRLWNDSFDETETPLRGQPSAISISVSHKMLAVAYIGKPVILWDLKDNSFYGNCGKKLSNGETSTHPVSALVFNPNVNIGLLVASYLDGQLALLDPFNDREEKSFRADCHILAASPDGRLLAGGAGSGIVQVYEFETLQLLYRVKSSNLYIKQLAFAQDGLRFADIRGPQCNIWEPAVLLRDMAGDDSSIDSSSSLVEAISSDSKVKITSIALHRNGDVAFCGKDDGSISVYSLRTGAQMGTLYNHKSLVRIVSWSPKIDVIMSVDTSNSICAWKLKHEKLDGWKLETKLCQCRLDCGKSIIQVLQGEQVGKFVLSTRESDHFWNIAGNQEQVREYSANPGIRKWFQHPQSQLHMICIDGMSARIYAWKDWSEVACVPLNIDVTGLQLKSVITFLTGPKQQILLDLSELDGSASTRKVYIFDTASVDINDGSASNLHSKPADAEDAIHTPNQQEGICLAVSDRKISSQLSTLAIYVSHIIGITNDGKLVFLDIHSWVCSASLDANRSSSFSYTRHFFVPADWFSGIRDIICALTKRDVVFSRNDNLVVIKNGLDYVEKVDVDVHVEDASSNRAAGLLRSERAASKYKT